MSHSANEFDTQTTYALVNLLIKLNFKSAKGFDRGGILFIEDLAPIMKNVTFDMNKLKLWKRPGK